MDHPTIRYLEDALLLRLPTKAPAATHERLLMAISEVIKGYFSDDLKPDPDAVATLLTLQQQLLPREKELTKCFTDD